MIPLDCGDAQHHGDLSPLGRLRRHLEGGHKRCRRVDGVRQEMVNSRQAQVIGEVEALDQCLRLHAQAVLS